MIKQYSEEEKESAGSASPRAPTDNPRAAAALNLCNRAAIALQGEIMQEVGFPPPPCRRKNHPPPSYRPRRLYTYDQPEAFFLFLPFSWKPYRKFYPYSFLAMIRFERWSFCEEIRDGSVFDVYNNRVNHKYCRFNFCECT